MPVRCLIFDLGKVLVDFSVDRACKQIATLADITTDQVYDFLFTKDYERQFECGTISFVQLHKSFEDTFAKSIPIEKLAHASADIFCPMEDSIALVRALKKQTKIPLILLSNTNEVHWDFIVKNWDIHKYFDHHVLSFREGAMKPTQVIYEKAQHLAACRPSECFFTDDLQSNIDGARALGWDAVLFSSPQQILEQLGNRGVQVQ